MSQCLLVWEQHRPGDRIVWGYCRKPRGHTGPCGPDHDRSRDSV